ncbi:MAG: hypothetical protein V3T77_07520 [Planctomycetota bacterium]
MQALRGQLKGQIGDPRDVPPGLSKALDQAQPQRIAHPGENDWDVGGRLLGRFCPVIASDEKEVRPILHEIVRRGSARER